MKPMEHAMNQDLDIIESMIDRHNVYYVLNTLACVMSAKADYIRENWQDQALADCWNNSCSKVLELAMKFDN